MGRRAAFRTAMRSMSPDAARKMRGRFNMAGIIPKTKETEFAELDDFGEFIPL